ncbi:MAG TPA: tetratricopeptide repeat protein [Longimicrobium sp.]|uniref:tetratricopeptide repeat protein n=1 Tax=Longimicrobium sp. TaxID=2029185 RepID=UPI002EDB96CD
MKRSITAAWAGALVLAALAGAGLRARDGRGAPPPVPPSAPMADLALREADIALFQQRAAEDPSSAGDRARLAYLYLQRARETGDYQDFRRAETEARASVQRRSTHNSSGRLALASSLLAQHRFAEARAAAEELVKHDPDKPSYRALLAEIQMELGDYEAAEASFGMLDAHRGDLAVAPRLARWLEMRGQTSPALELLMRSRDVAVARTDLPREQVAWFFLRVGDLELRNGRLNQAEQAFRGGLAVEPGDARLYMAMARVEAARGRPARALQWAGAVEARADLATLALMGDAHRALGDSASAERYFARLEREHDANPEPFARQWTQFRLDHGRQPAATLAVLRAESAARPDPLGFDMLGWALYLSGDVSGARAASRRALASGVRDATFEYHAGMISRAAGDRAAARRHLTAALDINPHFHPVHAAEARTALRELGN